MPRSSLGILLLLVPLTAVVVGGMYWMRAKAIAAYGSSQAISDWDDWRDAQDELVKQGARTKRKKPLSSEPPALVLMRDHFAACTGAAVMAAGGAFLVFAFLLRGVLAQPADPHARRAAPTRPPEPQTSK